MNWLRSRPAWLWITTAATIVYLLVELSFNAKLLDVIGGHSTAQEIDAIESWGRIISGYAVALVFWPTLILQISKRCSVAATAGFVLGATIVVIGLVYVAEENLVGSIAKNSTAEQKARAGNLLLLQQGILDEQIELSGIKIEDRASPASKAFIAALPVLALHIHDLDDKLATDKHQILEAQVVKAYHGSDGAYEIYTKSLRSIWETWNTYAVASNAYDDALAEIASKQANAWREYLTQLGRRGYRPDTLPVYAYSEARKQVRALGVPVTDHWAADDRVAFNRAIERRVMSKADAQFNEGLAAEGLASIPPGYSLTKFAGLEVVQSKWRKQIGYPEGVKLNAYSINNYPTQMQFEKDVFSKAIDINIREQLDVLDADPASFVTNGRMNRIGTDNVLGLIAPTIALSLSFLGAIVHIFKLCALLAQIVARNPIGSLRKYGAVFAAAASVVLTFSFLDTSSITQSELYTDLHEVVVQGQGSGYARLIRGAINAQPVLYEASSFVSPLLWHPNFGVEARK